MKARKKSVAKVARKPKAGSVCRICGKPATRLVDGDPSCEAHAELVYEDQVESYTQQHLGDGQWLEKV